MTAYAVAFGLAPQLPYWLMGWHWLLPLGGFVGLTLLAGLDIAVIGLLLALLWPAHLSMLSAPLVLVVFALGGIVVRGMFELIPW